MLNEDQQWDNQGTRHVVLLHGAAEEHVPGSLGLQNMVHWRREWQTTSVFLLGNPMNSVKRQKDMALKAKTPPQVVGV